jgi:hypothetical protein
MHAKLTVNATMDKESFAKQMEEMVRRSGRSNVIDAQANYLTQTDARAKPIETDPEGRK